MASISTGSGSSDVSRNMPQKNGFALSMLTSLFFMWGFITVLNDILIPYLKNIFELSYTGAMLIQFCFFTMYFLMSLPAGNIIRKIGYQNGIVLGLGLAGAGAFIFFPASTSLSYPLFLIALIVLSSGITILQVAANPYVSVLGKPENASSRLNLAQAYNSLGTTIGPILGAIFILAAGTYIPIDSEKSAKNTEKIALAEKAYFEEYGARPAKTILDNRNNAWFQKRDNSFIKFDKKGHFTHYTDVNEQIAHSTSGLLITDNSIEVLDYLQFEKFRNKEIKTIKAPYIIIAGLLFFLMIVFLLIRLPKIKENQTDKDLSDEESAWAYKHLILGAIAIFVYVGAEVSIGSILVNFLGESYIAKMPEKEAGAYIALYWGSAMIGRFLGANYLSDKDQKKKLLTTIYIIILAIFIAFIITSNLKDLLQGIFNTNVTFDKAAWIENAKEHAFDPFIFLGFVVLNIGAFILGKNKPNLTLSIFAVAATILVLLTVFTTGHFAMWTIIAVGLFNSIMFPTIFTLGIKDLGGATAQGSGIMCMAILGGAIIPMLVGVLADTVGIQYSFLLTVACYIFIAYYGIKGYQYNILKRRRDAALLNKIQKNLQ